MASAPIFVGTPKVAQVTIVNATGTTKQDLVTGGASGSKVTSITCASDDTAAKVVQVFLLKSGGSAILLGAASCAITGGSDGTTLATNLLGLIPGLPVDSDGQRYVLLETGDKIQVALNTGTVTAAKTLSITAQYGNF